MGEGERWPGGRRRCSREKEREGRVAWLLGGDSGGGGEREEKPLCGREGERGEGRGSEREEEKKMKMRKGEGGHEENEFSTGFMHVFQYRNSNFNFFPKSLHDGSVETVVLCWDYNRH